ncbi:MAG: hypothetical protein ACI35Q_00705 [Marinilabiliaceae bacterium]
MKRLIALVASALAFATVTSCDEEDRSTRFCDISIESQESVWYILGTDFWGTKMGDDRVVDHSDTTYYLSFNGDGTGIAYKHLSHDYYGKETFDSVIFRYETDDACHFDITSENGAQTLTFAKETYWSGGKPNTTCVIYRTDESSGRKIYHWHRCEEMRTDTALYEHEKMRGRLSVPKERVWTGKSVSGEYKNLSGSDPEYERLEFHGDGRFIFNKGNHELSHRPERRGEYRIAVGEERDSIFFKFDNGQEDEAYHIIFDWNGAFLYKDGTLAMELRDNYRECGY